MTVKRRCFICSAVLCVARDGQGVQKGRQAHHTDLYERKEKWKNERHYQCHRQDGRGF